MCLRPADGVVRISLVLQNTWIWVSIITFKGCGISIIKKEKTETSKITPWWALESERSGGYSLDKWVALRDYPPVLIILKGEQWTIFKHREEYQFVRRLNFRGANTCMRWTFVVLNRRFPVKEQVLVFQIYERDWWFKFKDKKIM